MAEQLPQLPDYIANDPCFGSSTLRPSCGLSMTTVFILRPYEWQAMWRGQVARAHFNSHGAAQAWIDLCNTNGEFRS